MGAFCRAWGGTPGPGAQVLAWSFDAMREGGRSKDHAHLLHVHAHGVEHHEFQRTERDAISLKRARMQGARNEIADALPAAFADQGCRGVKPQNVLHPDGRMEHETAAAGVAARGALGIEDGL